MTLANPEAQNTEALSELRRRAAEEIESGLLPSCQFALARNGRLIAFEALGDASLDSLYCMYSATKGVTSTAAWLLIQDGVLDTQLRVAELIPEFAENGKDQITVEQLFTHTAGFPHAPFRPDDWPERRRRLARFAEWTLNWQPGTRYEYHPTSSMWVIAELIERLSGMRYADFVDARITKPLGLHDLYLGAPDAVHGRIKNVQHTGEAMTASDFEALGLPVPPETEVTEEALENFNRPEVRRLPIPGGGGITNAATMALFYQGVLHGGLGEPVWRQATRERGLTPINQHPDLVGVPCNRALGLVIAGESQANLRGFGHANSADAFGHNGAGGQIAWADPATGLSFCYLTNGIDRNAIRQGRRGVSLSNRAAVL